MVPTFSPPSVLNPPSIIVNDHHTRPAEFSALPVGITASSSKFYSLGALSVAPINSIIAFTGILNDTARQTVVIDLRPFGQYSKTRIKGSLSICVPTTLLKRSSFSLSNIFKTMSDPHRCILDEKLHSEEPLDIIFYDMNSTNSHCSLHLYQIIRKFENISKDYNHKSIQLYFINKGFTGLLEEDDNLLSKEDSIFDLQKLQSSRHSSDSNSLADFQLPSANPTSSFLVSMKNNYVTVSNSGDARLITPIFSHPDLLPTWLQPFINSNSIDKIIRNFVRIETLENARIESVVAHKKHSPSICSPSCLCPSCDHLNYNIVDGSEHGFKNRYSNILPYEHSRVKLVASPMSPGNLNLQSFTSNTNSPSKNLNLLDNTIKDDYFNANFINVPKINKNSHYIATQAPLPSTIDDFWRVIWHNGVDVIVSLTDLNENGIQKSDIYWKHPQVELLEEIENYQDLTNLTLRKIKLKRRNVSRVIKQLHFKSWADHNITDFSDLLKLVSIKDEVTENRLKPVVVHCSAGCGRTGVFITIDLILSAFKFNDSDNDEEDCGNGIDIWKTKQDLIYFTVHQLRKQRISMVQNLNQFILCYETILQYFYKLNDKT